MSREIMKDEAQRLGLEVSDRKLAELQSYVGKNPMLARKAIQNEYLGLKQTKSSAYTICGDYADNNCYSDGFWNCQICWSGNR